MKKMKKYNWILFRVTFMVATLSACSCDAETEESAEEMTDTGVIELTQEQINNGGIQFGQFVQQEFNTSISVNGRVTSLPGNQADVSSYFGGNIIDIKVIPGQQVKKGDKLFVLENPDFINVQEEYLLTKIEAANYQIEYDRQKGLSMDNITSLKSFQMAEKELLLAQTKLSALSNELALMNISASNLSVSNISSRVAVYAPIDGVVSDVAVNLGSYITPEWTTVSIVGEGGKVLEFELFEKNLEAISTMNNLQFKMGNEAHTYAAEVLHVLPVVEDDSKSVKIHAQPVDPSVKLITGMYVGAEIQSKSMVKWSLPSNAVIKDGEKYYVWQKTTKAETLILTKIYVDLGENENDFIEILNYADFPEGAEVVIKGAFNL